MTGPNTTGGGHTIQAVERAFDIVAFLRENGPSTVTEVTEALGHTSSTAHIHLKTLHEVGYVDKDGTKYELGFRFLRDGIAVRNERQLYHVAKSEIDTLAEETGEGVGLGIEENGQRVTLYNAKGENAVSDKAPVGEFTNMHWTALGKALLAHKSRSSVERIVDHYGMPAATENTITDTDRLLDELDRTRERGYAIEDEERRKKLRSVALPVRVNDTTVGAVSITAPVNRMSEERIESDLVETVQASVNVIEVKYIYE